MPESLLEKLAAVVVAGNIFELEKFDPDEETEPASSGDFDTLDAHCREALRRNGVAYEAFSLWSSALKQAKRDVQSHLFSEAKIDTAKQVIRKRCFGLD